MLLKYSDTANETETLNTVNLSLMRISVKKAMNFERPRLNIHYFRNSILNESNKQLLCPNEQLLCGNDCTLNNFSLCVVEFK